MKAGGETPTELLVFNNSDSNFIRILILGLYTKLSQQVVMFNAIYSIVNKQAMESEKI